MFLGRKYMFIILKLMFTVHEYNFSRYKGTFSFRFHQSMIGKLLEDIAVTD